MTTPPVTIPRQPARTRATDYYRLRREGISLIEQMGSALWTDYNTHDPGITILESLCYVITELGYRSGWEIRDLLAPDPVAGPADPAGQAMFPASEILTVNPVTPDDYRRLLISLNLVRNAWAFCKDCGCDVQYYAWCEEDQLRYAFRKPAITALEVDKVEVRGLYEVLLELESDPDAGDLNNRKVELAPTLLDAGGDSYRLAMELRFPHWELARPGDWSAFLAAGGLAGLKVTALGATKSYDVLGDPALDAAGRDRYLRTHWNQTLYVSFAAEMAPGPATVAITHAALHLFGDNAARNASTVAALVLALEDAGPDGFVARYQAKARKVAAAVSDAKGELAAHRNLGEEYCRIRGVDIEDVAVCADIEVAADADIEQVQAKAWFLIERYFNPPVPHHSLQELVERGVPMEDIYNGPLSRNGFILGQDLAAAQLKSVLRGSDIIQLLMGIDGVLAVNSLMLSKYDQEGKVVSGAADPTLVDGVLVFAPSKSSATWQLFVSPLHQPRLYFSRSRFLFYKSGLPFLPRMDEARDTLVQLRGEAERPKIAGAAPDLAPPAGMYRNPAEYTPLQDSFPRAYGIGREGLPSRATGRRRAQARQLQAYLMVFEQLLANGYAQLAHAGDLFSLDPHVTRTYFGGRLGTGVIGAWNAVVDGLAPADLDAMLETPQEFHERRNRFLDHMLARFGEDFGEYALLLTNLRGEQAGLDRLIEDKIGFLKAYPLISRDRGRAFDHTRQPCAPDNLPGIKRRVSLLLGYPDLAFKWTLSTPGAVSAYVLEDRRGQVWLAGTLASPVTGPDDAGAIDRAWQAIAARMTRPDAWQVVPAGAWFRLTLSDRDNLSMGGAPGRFDSAAQAQEMLGELLSWSANARAIVVEHLLLRPKFPGDALYLPCSDDSCTVCDNGDPYSFRISFVMPGWTEPFNTNLALRGFADRTIQQELPSHLLAKVCWVGNDGFIENPCDPVVTELEELLEAEGLTAGGERPTPDQACSCANAIGAAFAAVFTDWYADRSLDYQPPALLRAGLEALFATEPDLSTLGCTPLFDAALEARVRAVMVRHFEVVAIGGWQFERFAKAWCAWLDADAVFDWAGERLPARVEAVLAEGLASGPPPDAAGTEALCACAANIAITRGEQFDAWLEANIEAGRGPGAFGPFLPPPAVLCAGMSFKAGTQARLEALLAARYGAYAEVSYWLRIVLRLLAALRNVYPGATLHDCDAGSDLNPVRLGSTALGNHPRPRRTLPAEAGPPAPLSPLNP